jgi:hypothetical protein
MLDYHRKTTFYRFEWVRIMLPAYCWKTQG